MAPPAPQPPEHAPVPCGWAIFVVISSPAAFLTMLFDSAGKEPHGAIFHLAMLLGPAAFGVASYFALLRVGRMTTHNAINVSVNVSFAASIALFVAALAFFIN